MDAFEVSVCVIALVCVCVRIIPVVSYRGEEVSVDAFEVSVYVKASIFPFFCSCLSCRCEEVGVDAFEINFSCPHGLPERKVSQALLIIKGG